MKTKSDNMKIEKNIPIPEPTPKEIDWGSIINEMQQGDSVVVENPHYARYLLNKLKKEGFNSTLKRLLYPDWPKVRVWKLDINDNKIKNVFK